ncbi:MAG: hypothetical protein J0L86_17215 [Flavobacteriales bacterium]|nr:hypothetical protein [Flavobacteriales bacterium]
MKLISLLSVIMLFSNSFLLTCSRENNVDNCTPSSLPFTSIETYFGCPNTKYSMDIDLNNTYTIIRNQAQFDQLVTISEDCPINLDLTNYDLIIGKKSLNSGNQNIEYEYFTDDCQTLVLRVTFNQDETLMAPNLTYHALVPKISDSETLQVETVVN